MVFLNTLILANASDRAQKNKKLLKEAAELLLTTLADTNTKAMLKSCRVSDSHCTYAMAAVVAQLKKAIAGDTKAFIAIRDVLGENLNLRSKKTTMRIKALL